MPRSATPIKDADEIRINLVLTRSRDQELFGVLEQLLCGVSNSHRAEVLRRQMSIWLEVSKRQSNVAPAATPATIPATLSRTSTPPPVVSRLVAGKSPVEDRHAAVWPNSPATPAMSPEPDNTFKGLDKSQFDGIEIDLDFTSDKR